MADKIIENNQVSITGKIVTGFTFSHQVYGEGFYTMDLVVKRLSDSVDRIPVMLPRITTDSMWKFTDSSVPITVMKKNTTGWCFPHLHGN